MMSYTAFVNEIAPVVQELQEECSKMTKEKFLEYQEEVIAEIRNNQPGISEVFITAVLDMIYKNVFANNPLNRAEVA